MTSYRHTFSKGERLCSRKVLEELFSKKQSRSFLQYPLLGVWRFQELPSVFPVQVAFSVPKKRFKRAHDRNRIKRQLREIYRLEKNILYQALSSQRLQCALVIVYIAPQKLPYSQINHACSRIFEKILAGCEPADGLAADGHGEIL